MQTPTPGPERSKPTEALEMSRADSIRVLGLALKILKELIASGDFYLLSQETLTNTRAYGILVVTEVEQVYNLAANHQGEEKFCEGMSDADIRNNLKLTLEALSGLNTRGKFKPFPDAEGAAQRYGVGSKENLLEVFELVLKHLSKKYVL